MELIKEPSDVQKAPAWHYAGMVINAIIVVLIAYIVYLRDAVTDLNWIIPTMAAVMSARAFVAYQETIPGRLNLKSAFIDIGRDLAKVTFGLVVSIALVFIMRFLLTGSFSAPL
jgi:hypothetical protein